MKTYWHGYTPSDSLEDVQTDVFRRDIPVQILGRSIRCSYNNIVFKPWCVDKMKLVLYFENVPVDVFGRGSDNKNPTDSFIIPVDSHGYSAETYSAIKNILTYSVEISSSIISHLRIRTLRTYHDNYFAFEHRDGYINLLFVVSDIVVDRVDFVEILQSIASNTIQTNPLSQYLSIDRYTGRIFEDGVVHALPLPFTYNELLPFLIIPTQDILRNIFNARSSNNSCHQLQEHFRNILSDNKFDYGECYNYVV